MNLLLNLLFAVLAFFAVRYIGGMVAPEGNDKDKIVTVIAVVAGILVFFANLASEVTIR